MFLIKCPYCEEKRPEIEFAYAGEAHIHRPTKDADVMSDEEWSHFMFFRDNKRGDHAERWWHNAGCNMFFNAVRNTVTDKFLVTYKMGEMPPKGTSGEAKLPAPQTTVMGDAS